MKLGADDYTLDPPSIAVNVMDEAAAVYASWNGSTETAAWQVLAGPTPETLSLEVKSVPRIGFETEIDVKSHGPFFQVNALDSSGRIIGTSRVVYAEEDDEE
ncbi:hypothetical protein [Paenibacillus sp. CECT 9249]|uniref:hypothetical protein n=1 Tax=Paenibacillus sp. CECT 9249 TaxID=2845385 RepID=UPI001E4C8DC3|nr:hypothetical protein [Paenibacillus sp. CECT 9249]